MDDTTKVIIYKELFSIAKNFWVGLSDFSKNDPIRIECIRLLSIQKELIEKLKYIYLKHPSGAGKETSIIKLREAIIKNRSELNKLIKPNKDRK